MLIDRKSKMFINVRTSLTFEAHLWWNGY